MNEQSSNPAPSMPRIENNKTITAPVGQVVVDGERRPTDEAKVAEWMESILAPIVVVLTLEDGGERVRLVAGLDRLEAAKRLGLATIQCTVLECDDALHVELAEIDEKLIRNDPGPAERALLTGRRAEIIRELAVQNGTLSQTATASRQSQRRAGEKTGADPGSVRDHAIRTGETKDTIQRSKKRFDTLGPAILKRIVGTSLDRGVELNALTEIPAALRDDLANRAVAGERVSARKELREAKREALEGAYWTDLDCAMSELFTWKYKYDELWEEMGLSQKINEIVDAFKDAVTAPEEADAPERTSEPAKEGKWFWRKDRKGD